jgi:hypothetical protein
VAKILGYSTMWDKLKPDYPPLPKRVREVVGLDIHHTTIRLDKRNGFYHAGIWQEVLKPRSPNRVIIRPEVEIQQPLYYYLYELEELANGDLVRWDSMENGIKMEPWVFRAMMEAFYGKTNYWREDYTKMIVLPIKVPPEPKITIEEQAKSKTIENQIVKSRISMEV